MWNAGLPGTDGKRAQGRKAFTKVQENPDIQLPAFWMEKHLLDTLRTEGDYITAQKRNHWREKRKHQGSKSPGHSVAGGFSVAIAPSTLWLPLAQEPWLPGHLLLLFRRSHSLYLTPLEDRMMLSIIMQSKIAVVSTKISKLPMPGNPVSHYQMDQLRYLP